MKNTVSILIVDDQEMMRGLIVKILGREGYQILTAEDGVAALEVLKEKKVDLIISDMKMPRMGGFDLLKQVKKDYPEIGVIIMTAFGTIPSAVSAIKDGAYDYLTKPFKKDELLHVVNRALERNTLITENRHLKNEISKRYHYQNIIGKSKPMLEIYKLLKTK